MKDINTIICDKLLGHISEEDNKRLQNWLECSLKHREQYDRFMKENNLENRYADYLAFDEKNAWKAFKSCNRLDKKRQQTLRILQYAAILLLPVLCTVSLWYFAPDAKREILADRVADSSAKAPKTQDNTPDSAHNAPIVSTGGPATWLYQIRSALKPNVDSTVSSIGTINAALTLFGKKEKWLTLEDGTIVHLNHTTSLIYPEHFEADNRTVRLEGEAYFEVAKDSKRPFYVITPSGVVREYGTSFNVNTYTPGYTKVVLVNGSIGLKSNTGRETPVSPGELAVITAKSEYATISRVDITPYVAWNDGNYVFGKTSLEELMNVIGYWYGYEIVYHTSEGCGRYFTGDINRKQGVVSIIRAINRVTDLHIEVSKDRKIIVRD